MVHNIYTKPKLQSEGATGRSEAMEVFQAMLCLTAVSCLMVLVIQLSLKGMGSDKLPPGPQPYPVIGNLLTIGKNPQKSLVELARNYGPIMRVRLGYRTIIVVSSSAVAKEVLLKHDLLFSARSKLEAFQTLDHAKFSIVLSSASTTLWKTLRKIGKMHIFAGHKLNLNEDLRQKKVQELLDKVQECCHTGEVVEIGQAVFNTTINIMSNCICSMDFSSRNSIIGREFRDLIMHIMKVVEEPNLSDIFPLLRKLDLQGIRRKAKVYVKRAMKIFDQIIDQKLELRTSGPGSETTKDMLDILLDIEQNTSQEIDRNIIKHFLFDLFIGGIDTVSRSMEWAMAELLRNPKILSKAREEIEQNIGKGNRLKESNIAQLPYLQAIIKETLRLYPPGPFSLPRSSEVDVEVAGFTIPKGTEVLVNLYAIGRDPCTWENPNSFVPERFLRSNIDFRGQNFELIPFGSGRRICIGMPLAIRIIPLIVGSLIHSFDWKLEDGVSLENLDMEPKLGLNFERATPLRAIPMEVS